MSSKVKVFVCESGAKCGGKKCCGALGAPALREACERWLDEEGLCERVKVLPASCLGFCKKGVATEIHEAGHAKKRWALRQGPRDFAKLQRKILKALGYDKTQRQLLLGASPDAALSEG
jgi:hypothetical protein